VVEWLLPLGIVVSLPVALLAGYQLFLPVRALTPAERFALSFAPVIAFLATAQLVSFALNLGGRVSLFACALVVVAAVISLRNASVRLDLCRVPRGLVFAIVVAAAQLSVSLILRRAFVGGGWFGDWWMHFDIARVFVHEQVPETSWPMGSTFASRNPLLNLLGASGFALCGSNFSCFASVTVACNTLAVAGVFLLAGDLPSRRVRDQSGFVAMFAATNFWILNSAAYTWPKMLALYFILLANHFYLRCLTAKTPDESASFLAPSVACLGLGFLAHQVTLVYAVPLVIHGLVSRTLPALGLLGRAAARAFWAWVPVVAWYSWIGSHFGLAAVVADSPTAKMMEGAGGAWGALTQTMQFLGNSLFGLPAVVEFVRQPGAQGLVRFALWFHMNLIPGLLTLPVLLLLPWALCAGRRHLHDDAVPGRTLLMWFLFGGLILSLVLHPLAAETGGAHSVFFPTAVTIAVLAWVSCLDLPQRLRQVTITLGALESFGMSWLHLASAEFASPDSGNLQLKVEKGLTFPADDAGIVSKILAAAILVSVQVWSVRQMRRCAADAVSAGR
jgi:hypothetical protein